MRAVYIITLLLPAVLSYTSNLDPLSNEFIDLINSKQSTWVAGRNFDENTPIEEIKKLLGAKLRDPTSEDIEEFKHSEDIEVPDSFDARQYFKDCTDVISSVPDQSSCGSCWAVAAASAMSDRRCIASNGKLKVPVSAEDLMSCCEDCGFGCGGGFSEIAWEYWNSNGISTGGLYNSSQGCKPYSLQPCEHHTTGDKVQCSTLDYQTPACKRQCVDPKLNYKSELTFAASPSQYFRSVDNIKREILQNGPVETGFDVYADFVNYKSGVYQHVSGKYLGGHAVRILGWGDENGIPYWLVSNSWNEDWGDKGLFKIISGKNEARFESNVVAGLPKV